MYVAPFCDESGLHIPTYQDILDSLILGAQGVYGVDVYLGVDSADYQFLSVIALKLFDSLQAVQLAYNNTCPTTAIGTGLSSLVKLNGVTRREATYSTCGVQLVGTQAITITSGVVQDEAGNKWDLPVSVTLQPAGSPIGSSFYLSCTATAQEIGAITALPSTITSIVTPTYGWTSVNNIDAAVAGLPVETDAQLRARQTISVSIPSLTKLDGTVAAIAATDNVTRYKVYENYTSYSTGDGFPPHSITCVVEGGTDADVAQAIYNNRGIGCDMWGGNSDAHEVEITVVSETTGLSTTIRFRRPIYIPVYATLYIYPTIDIVTGSTKYTTADTEAIETAVTEYLNSLQIGENLTISALYGVALSIMDDLSLPIFSIKNVTAGLTTSPAGEIDLAVGFDEVVQGIAANVNVVIVDNNGTLV